MKKIFALISVFSSLILNAQSPWQNSELPWYMDVYHKTHNRYHVTELYDHKSDTINKKDALNLQKGYWMICLLDSVTQMKFIAAEGFYQYGKRTGTWKYYHPNGKLRAKGDFFEGKLMGPYETYYEDGAIREKGNWNGYHEVGRHQYFKKDILNMESVYDGGGKVVERFGYYEDGKMSFKENDSLMVYFHPNGISSSVAHRKNGQLNGYTYNYDANGNLTEKSFYTNSKRNGQLFLYYKNGNIKFHANFLDDRMSGERMYYDENGKPIEGNFTFYNNKGGKEREGYCINGKPEGLVKLFRTDGTVLMTVQHKNGQPYGKQTYYAPDGTTVTEELIYIDGQYAGMGKTSVK
jgi:YD repeat-containing protein